MITVYLDQNKWIDLARAATGHPLGVPFVPTLAALKEAADSNVARFPLSAAHYFETAKQHDVRRRKELAATMTRLAGTLRIAPPHAIVPSEIRAALIDVLHLPIVADHVELFGMGAAHALAAPTLKYTAPTEWGGQRLSRSVQQTLQGLVEPEFEEFLLAGTMPEGIPDDRRLVLGNMRTLTDDRFVDGQEKVAKVIESLGKSRLNDVMLATAIADIMDPLQRAANDLGVSVNEVLDSDLFALISRMPSRWVEMMLRRQRQANPQKAWEGNDLNDLTALAIAVPYVDVVVTERSWSAMLNAARVPERFGTLVTPNLQDLLRHLEAH